VLLAGEIHVLSAEILHHHDEVARICQIEHHGGTYLHASQDLSPLCPLCQIVRTGSVRPAFLSPVQKLDQESTYQPIVRQSLYSPKLAQSLLARGPPLS
jgi:hypothetical protein